ncbi:hypothetical protein DL766_004136 [Monosporascus sp. MC13-8B]|uniref:Uncharacterized protein n=1 Tax=Monosporascus cannonballus TaxID=155416 RepID=A0ABY0H7P9_9PEZI|nr:hypothetical protein DL762_005946 [Monosporascus cannonballus]RYP01655.1 hypothetical protein DL763_000044 [Monosporascus cannonballus]RYP32026.1 hypothetical protein DL766_004136 [Monosporascus sp. MC13-8B]
MTRQRRRWNSRQVPERSASLSPEMSMFKIPTPATKLSGPWKPRQKSTRDSGHGLLSSEEANAAGRGEEDEVVQGLREQAIRFLWMENGKQARDKLQEISKNPEEGLQPIFAKIKAEDASLTTDYFYQHLRTQRHGQRPRHLPAYRERLVARFLMRHPAPEEYETCIEAFSALPTHTGMAVSRPTRVTLFVFAVDFFTEQHHDRHGFASLVPLGDYTDTGDGGVQEGDLPCGTSWNAERGSCRRRRRNPWHRLCRLEGPEAEGGIDAAVDADADDDAGLSGGDDENEYDSSVTEEIDVEKPPEGGWTDADIHGGRT